MEPWLLQQYWYWQFFSCKMLPFVEDPRRLIDFLEPSINGLSDRCEQTGACWEDVINWVTCQLPSNGSIVICDASGTHVVSDKICRMYQSTAISPNAKRLLKKFAWRIYTSTGFTKSLLGHLALKFMNMRKKCKQVTCTSCLDTRKRCFPHLHSRTSGDRNNQDVGSVCSVRESLALIDSRQTESEATESSEKGWFGPIWQL